ncbi:hypothetical protein OC845_002419 [Tilletia horrida]|nr:hypothetical protein OC845_002419 [Tilletia horrida]
MSTQRPLSRLSAFFGSLGRTTGNEAIPPAAAEGEVDEERGEATAQPAGPSQPPPPSAPSQSADTPHSRTFFKRKRPNPHQAWLQHRQEPYKRKRVRALFGTGVLLLVLSIAIALLLFINLLEPIPALIPSANTPGTASLWFALSAALIVAPSLLVFELSSKATHAVHSTSTGMLALALLLVFAIAPLRHSETLLCAPMIGLALIACAWALLSSFVVGRLQVAYALQAPPGIFIPTGEQPHQELPQATAAQASEQTTADAQHVASGRVSTEAEDDAVADEHTPLLNVYTTSVQRAQRGWRRVVKLTLAIIGTLTISVLIGLQSFNLLLTGTDAGLHPVGDRVWINPTAQLAQDNIAQNRVAATLNSDKTGKNHSIEIPPLPLPDWFLSVPPFQLHVACESSPPHTGHQGLGDAPSRPTALFFAERGVSGQIGARWVRDMVLRAADGDDYGDIGAGRNSTDDGHLSLEKVCFFDRMGYGHSDFVGGAEGVASVRLHTLALYSALGSLGVLNGSYPLDPDRSPVNETIPPQDVLLQRQEQQHHFEADLSQHLSHLLKQDPKVPPAPHHNHSANGTSPPFMLIAQGYGALHARHFAATFPTLVHSILYVDAETPTSFYTDAVSSQSGLRAGYGAWGHAWGLHTPGFLAWDVAPALFEPLGVVRLVGLLFLGRTARDRVLAPRFRGGAHRRDAGGGGWRLFGAGGANGRLLTTSLAERLDANRGAGIIVPDDDADDMVRGQVRYRSKEDDGNNGTIRIGGSRNYHELTKPEVVRLHSEDLAERPTAVLSSFWKIHADVPGWAEIQRSELVKTTRERNGLVGWWRLGSPVRSGSGGDGGEAEGICADPMGKIYCEEAVRKLLAQGDLDARHRRKQREEEEQAKQAGVASLPKSGAVVRESVFDANDDLDPLKPWPSSQRRLQ